MVQFAVLVAPGAASDHAGAALERALTKGGLRVERGPTEAIPLFQLAAGVPMPEVVTWAPAAEGTVVQVHAGASFNLQPEFVRTLSRELGGLVMAMEVARGQDRYLIGSFLAGRTIELTMCQSGVVSGPGGRAQCGTDKIVEHFMSWTGGRDPRHLAVASFSGLQGVGEAAWPSETEVPLTRVAIASGAASDWPGWRCRATPAGVVMLERDGAFEPELESIGAGPAVRLNLPGDGGVVRWQIVDPSRPSRSGTARGHAELVAAVPAWALG